MPLSFFTRMPWMRCLPLCYMLPPPLSAHVNVSQPPTSSTSSRPSSPWSDFLSDPHVCCNVSTWPDRETGQHTLRQICCSEYSYSMSPNAPLPFSPPRHPPPLQTASAPCCPDWRSTRPVSPSLPRLASGISAARKRLLCRDRGVARSSFRGSCPASRGWLADRGRSRGRGRRWRRMVSKAWRYQGGFRSGRVLLRGWGSGSFVRLVTNMWVRLPSDLRCED